MQPVVEQIGEAAEYPTPVWQPIQFQGFDTLLEELQNSRSLIRLLQLEVDHALYHTDSERALRGLESMGGVASAFDWELVMVAELIQIALRQVHQSMIRRSLACDLWNEGQLQSLTAQLGGPRDVAVRWRRVIAGERAMVLSALRARQLDDRSGISPGVGLLLSVPSLQEPIIRGYQVIETVGAGGLVGLTGRAGKAEEELSNQGWPLFRSFLPAIHAFAAAFEREESSRRFARTALAMKLYQLRNGHWPERLSQLEQVGLSVSDWNTVSGGQFGYEVAGDEAFLWSYIPGRETRVRSTRLEVTEEEHGSESAAVRIR